MSIYASSNKHCVERGISTMRLALGYETGLPKGWPIDIIKRNKQVIQLCGLAFPDRQVLGWWEYENNYKIPQNVLHKGRDWKSRPDMDNYLSAFTYGENGNDFVHFVVGEPVWHGNIQINIIIAVSLEK